MLQDTFAGSKKKWRGGVYLRATLGPVQTQFQLRPTLAGRVGATYSGCGAGAGAITAGGGAT